jgi:hypothetical protein
MELSAQRGDGLKTDACEFGSGNAEFGIEGIARLTLFHISYLSRCYRPSGLFRFLMYH